MIQLLINVRVLLFIAAVALMAGCGGSSSGGSTNTDCVLGTSTLNNCTL